MAVQASVKARIFAAVQSLVPQRAFSHLVGKIAASETSWVKKSFIAGFRQFYAINLAEAELENPNDYRSFNHFFTRALKPDARPLPTQNDLCLSPADGIISETGRIESGRILQAKNHDYRLDELLPVDMQDWLPFVHGDFATIYLAPRDYHRVHMPLDGRLIKTVYVPGDLYSVNQATATSVSRLFARNERLVAFFENEQGPFCMVLVGAMIVSGIETVFHGLYRTRPKELLWDDQPLDGQGEVIEFKRGDEFGRFLLGSTVILVTPPGMVDLHQFRPGDRVRCRAAIGRVTSPV